MQAVHPRECHHLGIYPRQVSALRTGSTIDPQRTVVAMASSGAKTLDLNRPLSRWKGLKEGVLEAAAGGGRRRLQSYGQRLKT